MKEKIFPSRLKMLIPEQDVDKNQIINFLYDRGFGLGISAEQSFLYDKKGDLPNIRMAFASTADAFLQIERQMTDLAIINEEVKRNSSSYQVETIFNMNGRSATCYRLVTAEYSTRLLMNEFIRRLKPNKAEANPQILSLETV